MSNGKWGCIDSNGKYDRKRFESFDEMARYANKKYGLNRWTYQWYPIKRRIYGKVFELVCRNEQCNEKHGKIGLKRCRKKPYAASRNGHLWFDYYKCPECKVVYAFEKE